MDDSDVRELAGQLVTVAHAAGAATMRHYAQDITVERKDNDSPVTAADREAEAIILEALRKVLPGVPIVAEEEASAGRIPDIGRTFFLVDPLDGTREFINRRDEFTVNIALVHERVPVFGIVYAPAIAQLYVTTGGNRAVEARLPHDAPPAALDHLDCTPLHTRATQWNGLSVVASRSHLDDETRAFISRYDVKDLKNAGSSLKFCLLARGQADLYPRFGPTMEWDTAAGDAVLRAAGGLVTTTDGRPFLYGKTETGYRNPGFIAWGREIRLV